LRHVKIKYKGSAYLPPPPFLSIQKSDIEEKHFVGPKKVHVFEYYALSDGIKTVFTDADMLVEYGMQRILPPYEVSYYNLFINGVLQPPAAYNVEQGKLILNTEDTPILNAPIILQMIKME